MSFQPFLIAPFKNGLETDLDPWLLPEDAFSEIINGHIHHGRLEKRAGRQLWASFPTTSTNYAISAITQADPAVVTLTSSAGLSIGQEIQINYVQGMTELNGDRFLIGNIAGNDISLQTLDGVDLDSTAYAVYTTGGQVSTFEGNPIMGIFQVINDSTREVETVVLDTRRMALYSTNTQSLEPIDTTDVFPSTSNSDFFWAAQWQYPNSNNRLYVTNGVDGIRYFEPVTSLTTSSALVINTVSSTVITAKLIFAFENRLVLLYTTETAGVKFPQRMRWSQWNNGAVWDDLTPGLGGRSEPATGDEIISARFLGNVLIVFFSQSIWAIRPKNDPREPFTWIKINNFRSTNAKMASVSFDEYVGSAGKRGLVATDTVGSRRIDEKIEDFVTSDVLSSAWEYVFIARDYNNLRTWTLYPSAEENATESDKVLILDEDSGAFSTYDLPMSVLGYGGVGLDYSLDDFNVANGLDYSIDTYIENAWDETLQSYSYDKDTEVFLGGDHSGNVFVMQFSGQDVDEEITFEITSAAWNPYKDKGMQARFGYIDFFVDTNFDTQFTVEFFKNNSIYPYASQVVTCLPNLNFVKNIISATQANPCLITSNQHGLVDGQEIYIYGAQGMPQLIGGPFTVANATTNSFELQGFDTSTYPAYTGNGVITTDEYSKNKEWKRAYANGVGYQHKIKITNTSGSLIIHGMMPYFRPIGNRVVNR